MRASNSLSNMNITIRTQRMVLACTLLTAVVLVAALSMPILVRSWTDPAGPRVNVYSKLTDEDLQLLHPDVRHLYRELINGGAVGQSTDQWKLALSRAGKVEGGYFETSYFFSVPRSGDGKIFRYEEGRPYIQCRVASGQIVGAVVAAPWE